MSESVLCITPEGGLGVYDEDDGRLLLDVPTTSIESANEFLLNHGVNRAVDARGISTFVGAFLLDYFGGGNV